MREIMKDEMMEINGGYNGVLITALVSGIVTFITGILHGYANPKKCNN